MHGCCYCYLFVLVYLLPAFCFLYCFVLFFLGVGGGANRPIPHKLIGWANYFLLKCWGDVMLPFKHCFNGQSVKFQAFLTTFEIMLTTTF